MLLWLICQCCGYATLAKKWCILAGLHQENNDGFSVGVCRPRGLNRVLALNVCVVQCIMLLSVLPPLLLRRNSIFFSFIFGKKKTTTKKKTYDINF